MPICRTVHDTEAAILATTEQSYVLHVVMRKQVVADPGRVARLRVFLSVVSPTPTYLLLRTTTTKMPKIVSRSAVSSSTEGIPPDSYSHSAYISHWNETQRNQHHHPPQILECTVSHSPIPRRLLGSIM